MEQVVKTLTGLTDAEEALLVAEGVVNAGELSIVTYRPTSSTRSDYRETSWDW
jgi:hypothetical protein